MISTFINNIHLFFVYFPLLFLLIPIKYSKSYYKWILLLSIFVPLHWKFVNNRCFLTDLSKYFGAYSESKTDSEFSEENFKWLYYPIMNFIGWKWDNEGLDKMVTLHWILYIVIYWYFIFYIL